MNEDHKLIIQLQLESVKDAMDIDVLYDRAEIAEAKIDILEAKLDEMYSLILTVKEEASRYKAPPVFGQAGRHG